MRQLFETCTLRLMADLFGMCQASKGSSVPMRHDRNLIQSSGRIAGHRVSGMAIKA